MMDIFYQLDRWYISAVVVCLTATVLVCQDVYKKKQYITMFDLFIAAWLILVSFISTLNVIVAGYVILWALVRMIVNLQSVVVIRRVKK